MNYIFKLISNENDDFVMDLAINSTATFLSIHNFIQNELGYDPMQLASFFITDYEWNKEIEITLFDMMDGTTEDIITMDKAIISNYISSNKQRMLYVFDMFSERAFFMELFDIKKDITQNIQLIQKEGIPPKQIEIDLSLPSDSDFGIDQFETEEELDELYRYQDDIENNYDFNEYPEDDY
ncbi:MAG: hypothetical protein JW717_06300 [Marinilabiliaceae bacterium]|nr:hypothetical protein [Marinilabiliaceae bacterium]